MGNINKNRKTYKKKKKTNKLSNSKISNTSSEDVEDTCDGKVEAREVATEAWEVAMGSREPNDDGGEVHSGEEMTATKRFLSNSQKQFFS